MSAGDETLRMLQGIGALINPAVAGAIASAVNRCLLDDRDPAPHELPYIRRGLEALAEHYFGPPRNEDRRKISGRRTERPEWAQDVREVTILYRDVETMISDGTKSRAFSLYGEKRGEPRSAHATPQRRRPGRGHPFHPEKG
jgi:hypothetical protein